MRGNLVWKEHLLTSEVTFVPDANGEYEVVDGGRLIRHDNFVIGKSIETILQPKQEQVESNPEKDYVITAYRRDGKIFKDDGNFYSSEMKNSFIIPNRDDEIYSVKRNSDKEEFSVDEITEQGKINFFKIHGEEIVTECSEWGIHGFTHYKLSELTKKKYKQILFTTDDGVKIYSNDERYYVVITKEGFGYEPYTVAWCGNGDIHGANYEHNCKTFSSKEKAEEYVRDNKPLFSVNDIIKNSIEQKKGEWEGFYWLDIAKFMHLAHEKLKR